MVLMNEWQFGYYPHSVGLRVRTDMPKSFRADPQNEPVTITVRRDHLRLNARTMSIDELPAALRAELSRRANPVVCVEAEGDLGFADIALVIDIARSAWFGVPVVLVPPKLKKKTPATARLGEERPR